MLDFTPNAVHSGHLRGAGRGLLRRRRRSTSTIHRRANRPTRRSCSPPAAPTSRSSTSPTSGSPTRTGLDLVGADADRAARRWRRCSPADGRGSKRPRDLDGHTVGVTGLPSDDAVVDSEVERRRRRPGRGRRSDDRLQRGRLAGRRQGRRGDRLLERRGVALEAPGRPAAGLQSRRIRRSPLPRADPDHDPQGAGERTRLVEAMVAGDHARLRIHRDATRRRRSTTCSPPTRPRTRPNRKRS